MLEGRHSIVKLMKRKGLATNSKVNMIFCKRPAFPFVNLHGLTVATQGMFFLQEKKKVDFSNNAIKIIITVRLNSKSENSLKFLPPPMLTVMFAELHLIASGQYYLNTEALVIAVQSLACKLSSCFQTGLTGSSVKRANNKRRLLLKLCFVLLYD